MHKRCKCGFMMSDVMSSNNTALDLYFEPISTLDGGDHCGKPHIYVFHCECCHKLYLFRSGIDKRSYVLALTDVISSGLSEVEADSQEVYFLLIGDDEDKVFKGFWSNDRKRMLLEYHDKTAVFEAESIYEGDEIIYQHNYPIKFIFDESSVDRSTSARMVRCLCGWLINQEISDDKSFIDLYDEAHWKMRVRYELGEEEELHVSYIRKRGLCCEKCRSLMLPDEHGKYIVYKPMIESIDKDSVFSFLYYSIYPLDVYSIKFGKYRKCNEVPSELNKIFISEDKKYLRVHIGDAVVYYQAEKKE